MLDTRLFTVNICISDAEYRRQDAVMLIAFAKKRDVALRNEMTSTI